MLLNLLVNTLSKNCSLINACLGLTFIVFWLRKIFFYNSIYIFRIINNVLLVRPAWKYFLLFHSFSFYITFLEFGFHICHFCLSYVQFCEKRRVQGWRQKSERLKVRWKNNCHDDICSFVHKLKRNKATIFLSIILKIWTWSATTGKI